MSAKYRAGDRVRVVLEGEVRGPDPLDDSFKVGFNRINPNDNHVMSVEKLEPPVVTFKPGDTVRSRCSPTLVYTIGREGYFAHLFHEWRPVDSPDYEGAVLPFTAAEYELVELK